MSGDDQLLALLDTGMIDPKVRAEVNRLLAEGALVDPALRGRLIDAAGVALKERREARRKVATAAEVRAAVDAARAAERARIVAALRAADHMGTAYPSGFADMIERGEIGGA